MNENEIKQIEDMIEKWKKTQNYSKDVSMVEALADLVGQHHDYTGVKRFKRNTFTITRNDGEDFFTIERNGKDEQIQYPVSKAHYLIAMIEAAVHSISITSTWGCYMTELDTSDNKPEGAEEDGSK